VAREGPGVIRWWLCEGPVSAGPWLAPQERGVLAGLRVEKRRADWLIGRWTIKNLIRTTLKRTNGADVDLSHIAVLAGDDGAPHAVVAGRPLHGSVSISHSHGVAFCALAEHGDVGADIERVEPRSPRFVADYFTPEERSAVASAVPIERDRLANAIWSAKESVLKARKTGLRDDPRSISCLPRNDGAAWRAVSTPSNSDVTAWWRETHDHVLTLAVLDGDGRTGSAREA